MKQLAPSPSQRGCPPYGLVSLWDMLRFHAEKFLEALNTIGSIETLSADPDWLLSSSSRTLYIAKLDVLISHLSELNLDVSKKKAAKLRFAFAEMGKTSEPMAKVQQAAWMSNQFKDLKERIEDELEGRALFYLSDDVDALAPGFLAFGEAVNDAFPSASYDIDEAAKCLALGRATACVMHLMRALEVGLRLLAKELSLPMKSDNWNTILNEMEKEIRGRSKQSHGDRWTIDEPFYTEAATHFRLVKNAWRNHSQHMRSTYSREKAKDIFDSVRSFMRHLSERLSEGPDGLGGSS